MISNIFKKVFISCSLLLFLLILLTWVCFFGILSSFTNNVCFALVSSELMHSQIVGVLFYLVGAISGIGWIKTKKNNKI